MPPQEDARYRMRGLSVGIVRQLREERERRRWSQTRLADEMTARGFDCTRNRIAHIELGRAEALPVDWWVGFAAALDVPPLALLVPPDEDWQPTPNATPMPPGEARRWLARTGRVRTRTGTAAARGAVGGAKTVESLADRLAALEHRIGKQEGQN